MTQQQALRRAFKTRDEQQILTFLDETEALVLLLTLLREQTVRERRRRRRKRFVFWLGWGLLLLVFLALLVACFLGFFFTGDFSSWWRSRDETPYSPLWVHMRNTLFQRLGKTPPAAAVPALLELLVLLEGARHSDEKYLSDRLWECAEVLLPRLEPEVLHKVSPLVWVRLEKVLVQRQRDAASVPTDRTLAILMALERLRHPVAIRTALLLEREDSEESVREVAADYLRSAPPPR